MNFTFKIGQKIKEAWPLYKENLWSFLLLTLITFILSSTNRQEDYHLVAILMALVNFFVLYVWIRSILNLIDKKEFKPFSVGAIPDWRKYWNFASTMILTAVIIIIGFVFLIVPGLYFSGRLFFAIFLSLEKNQGAISSIKESWNMTKDFGWSVFWKGFVIKLFILAGFVALFIGSFITYPLGMIVMVMLYREFLKFRRENPIPVEVKKEEPKKEAEILEVRG